jgi:hypothetical protein
MIQAIFGLVIVIGVMIVRGLTIKLLWSWFVCPQFNVNQLSLVSAIGISLLVGIITQWKSFSKKEIDENKSLNVEDTWHTLLYNGLIQTIMLFVVMGIGWALYSFQ